MPPAQLVLVLNFTNHLAIHCSAKWLPSVAYKPATFTNWCLQTLGTMRFADAPVTWWSSNAMTCCWRHCFMACRNINWQQSLQWLFGEARRKVRLFSERIQRQILAESSRTIKKIKWDNALIKARIKSITVWLWTLYSGITKSVTDVTSVIKCHISDCFCTEWLLD